MRSILPLFSFPLTVPKLKSSYLALLGRPEPVPIAVGARTEDIRQLMLTELGQQGEKKFPGVARRLRFAPDVQGLWYARSDLMAILAKTHGEIAAREKLADISSRFNGLMPSSLTSKTGLRGR